MYIYTKNTCFLLIPWGMYEECEHWIKIHTPLSRIIPFICKSHNLHTPMNVGNPHTQWSHKENILLFIFTSLKFIMLIWANFIRFMLVLISLFHQIEEPLQSQRRCWLLTCVNYLVFFLEECSKVGVLSVSIAWRRVELSPTSHVQINYIVHIWTQNFFLKNILGCKYVDLSIHEADLTNGHLVHVVEL